MITQQLCTADLVVGMSKLTSKQLHNTFGTHRQKLQIFLNSSLPEIRQDSIRQNGRAEQNELRMC
jgi:hypothetical protein